MHLYWREQVCVAVGFAQQDGKVVSMPAVQVRNFPQEVYEQIRQEARESGRSITQQVKSIVMNHYAQKKQGQASDGKAGGMRRPPSCSAGLAWQGDTLRGESAASCPVCGQGSAPTAVPALTPAQARRAKRAELFGRIDAKPAKPFPAEASPRAIVREMRDAR